MELWRRDIRHVTNVYFEGYNVDILIPDSMIVVEVDGLQHYQERIQEKDMRKIETLREAGYDVFRIQASDIRRDPESIAELIKAAHTRRLEAQARGELSIVISRQIIQGAPHSDRAPSYIRIKSYLTNLI
ncbi:hypothetical protein HRbin02_01022 [Candidatus Calditenuaceae archaeon HR02]|nr:hypothetical protein HRbin02_01022 [Candidatus Calditenuaceae archaeon HR02]